jgi:hypothetical protein
VKQDTRRLVIGVAVIAAASTILKPAHAVDTGTAVGIGLGSFALGSALGSAPRPNPYYYPYSYYYPAPAYYAPPPYYPPPRRCWDPYYRHYYAC